ncbi:MAG TPA: hypothetical protein DEP69_02125, partial [Acidimicrobiaceae bacterium]|nr:hypothetical protein [Acidimicrobiaceae bacterium]
MGVAGDAAAEDGAPAEGGEPVRRGGSRLFPQLPDDPRLIEAERQAASAGRAAQAGQAAPTVAAGPEAQTSAMNSAEFEAMFAPGGAATGAVPIAAAGAA